MKRASFATLVTFLLMLVSVSAFTQISAVPPLMNFQGRLAKPDGTPVADGNYAIRFSLWDAVTGGNQRWSQTLNPVMVRNGVFAVLLGSGNPLTETILNGNVWLEIKVGGDPPLSPRQQLVSVAYAFKANTVPDNAIGSAQLANNAVATSKIADGAVIGSKIGTSAVSTIKIADNAVTTAKIANLAVTDAKILSVDWSKITNPPALTFWSLLGNAGTTPGTNFLGTTDNKALDFRVNNLRALRLEPVSFYPDPPNSNDHYEGVNILGGHDNNSITDGVVAGTIGGGGYAEAFGTRVDRINRVTDIGGTVSGGIENRAGNSTGTVNDANFATVGGGQHNLATGSRSTIGGGEDNTSSGFAALVGGGFQNSASGQGSIVSGGYFHAASGNYASIGGGFQNSVSGNNATVAGGSHNTAAGDNSFAGGRQAKANHDGTFVWADSTGVDFASTGINQFLIKAGGGVGINTNATGSNALTVNGTVQMTGFKLITGAVANHVLVSDASGNGTWGSLSVFLGPNSVTNAMIQSVDWSKITNAPAVWLLGGNASTSSSHFLGTTDNKPLEVRVNNHRAMRYQYAEGVDGFGEYRSINVLGGSEINVIASGVAGATIAGGGQDYFTHTDGPNQVLADFGTVGGGIRNTASGSKSTVGGGYTNTASGNSATVGGGDNNTAGGIEATVGGGYLNTVSGSKSTVGGGYGNNASGSSATVGGGNSNTAGGDYATVGGGYLNTASGNSATVGGGKFNTASDFATIAGGYSNNASGSSATIGGGHNNTASGESATIGGGHNNTAGGIEATVGGGYGNNASDYATVGGGLQNTASDIGGTIGGGYLNIASGLHATIGGGNGNTASGPDATVGGGGGNTASAGATVGGGDNNTASNAAATVGGGYLNNASGLYATVGGGWLNHAIGFLSFVGGGFANTAGGDYSFAAGRFAKANHDGAFVWADQGDPVNGTNFLSTGINQFLIRASGGVGINTNAPSGHALNVNGSIQMTGFKLLTGAAANRALLSDANGVGTWGLVDTPNLATGAVTNSKIADGSVTAAKLDPALLNTFSWHLGGNAGTTSANFLGTTDDQPLELRTKNRRAMRYQYAENTVFLGAEYRSINTLGGSEINTISAGVVGATIAGGGSDYFTTTDYPNRVTANFGSIGGGNDNNAGGNAATVGGGAGNGANDVGATIAGGVNNTVRGSYGAIPGGKDNTADGLYSFAGGRRAKSNHNGAFVWADSTDADFATTRVNQFFVRASGGVRFYTKSDLTLGVTLGPDDTAWSSLSDRNIKTAITPVDPETILEHLIAIPIATWQYKGVENPTRHIGPMAQDFFAAFSVGTDDKHISTIDADGVALAAIQGMHSKVKTLQTQVAVQQKQREADRAEVNFLRAENAELKARLAAIEAAVAQLKSNQK